MYIFIGGDDFFVDVPFYGSISNFELKYSYSDI